MVNKKLSRSDIKSVKELLEGGRSPLTIQDYVKKELSKNISLARISEIKKQNNIKVKCKGVPSVSEFIKEKELNKVLKEKDNMKSYFQGTFAAHAYSCMALLFLWLNHLWKNQFTDYMAVSSIIFIILSFIIANHEHDKVSAEL